jgi:hypothetical protein
VDEAVSAAAPAVAQNQRQQFARILLVIHHRAQQPASKIPSADSRDDATTSGMRRSAGSKAGSRERREQRAHPPAGGFEVLSQARDFL